MRFGTKCPKGFLPVFSTDTEEQARQLIAATCPLGHHGNYVAPELAETQTLDNLYAFGDRLQEAWERLFLNRQDDPAST